MNQSLKCISVQEFPDAADIVKLMESTLAHLPDLLVHAHSLIKDNVLFYLEQGSFNTVSLPVGRL